MMDNLFQRYILDITLKKTLFECGDHPDDDIDVRVKYFKTSLIV